MCWFMFPFIKSKFLSCFLFRQVTSESVNKGTAADSLTAYENNNPGYQWQIWFVILIYTLQNSESS